MRGSFLPLWTRHAALALLVGLLLAGPASAQVVNGNLLPNPRLSSVMPAGARAGTSVEITLTGTDLEEPQALVFSHAGIKATPIIPPAPTPDPKKPAPMPTTPPPVPKFNVTIGPDVPLGTYDVRLVNKWGVSNPRSFVIGDLAEALEKEPNNDVEQAQRVEVGTTVNGVIASPTDVDYFVFAGKKGQRVVIHCLAASIDSRLQPELRLFDAGERQLAYQRPAPGDDALLDTTLPADGEYFLRLCQFTYTLGSADSFYRLNISTAPYIDLMYPPMVEPGKATQVTLYGRNLPGGKLDPAAVVNGRALEKVTVTVTAPNEPQTVQRLSFSGSVAPTGAAVDGFEYRLKTPATSSNPFLVMFAEAPVVLDNENNDTPATAQEITLPCEIAGRIEKRRDRDWYSFTAKKGDVYMIEVLSHRLGAPTDMYLSLRSAGMTPSNPELFQGDDTPETLSQQGFYTASRDPAPFRFVVPADGKYLLLLLSHLSDTMADTGHYYRVRITPERPDFRLFAMPPDHYRPDAASVGQGGNQTFTVYAWRRDGFKGDISLSVEGLPSGVTCPPQVLSGNMKTTALVVSAAANAPAWTGEVKVLGTAVINGQNTVREARPATITWPVQPQQNIPTITRLDKSLMLAVREQAPYVLTTAAEKASVLHGDKATVQVKVTRHWPDVKGPIQIQPVPFEMPTGLTFQPATIAPGQNETTVAFTALNNVPPGTYNLVFRSFTPVTFNKDAKAKQKPNLNVVQSSTPLQLTILPRDVATLTVDNPNPTVKLGTEAAVLVRVARKYDYAGEFKVELVLPPDPKGLSVASIVIPPGQNEAKLTLRTSNDAGPGPRPNLVLRAVAVLNGNVPITHETKLNVNVTK